MSKPFKKIIKNTNTSESSYQKGTKIDSEVKTRICNNCKTPRPTDTSLTTCNYCGFKFMDIDVEIKLDN